MGIRKLLCVSVLSLVLAFSGLALFGCGGKSDEDLIREQVAAELDSIKSISDDTVAAFTEGAGEDAFMDFGVTNEEFVLEYFKGFDYTIDSVTVDGDTATVQITMTVRTMGDFQTVFNQKADAFIESEEFLTMETEEQLNQRLGEMLMESVQETQLTQTDPLALTFSKVDGEWTADDAAIDMLSAAMM